MTGRRYSWSRSDRCDADAGDPLVGSQLLPPRGKSTWLSEAAMSRRAAFRRSPRNERLAEQRSQALDERKAGSRPESGDKPGAQRSALPRDGNVGRIQRHWKRRRAKGEKEAIGGLRKPTKASGTCRQQRQVEHTSAPVRSMPRRPQGRGPRRPGLPQQRSPLPTRARTSVEALRRQGRREPAPKTASTGRPQAET